MVRAVKMQQELKLCMLKNILNEISHLDGYFTDFVNLFEKLVVLMLPSVIVRRLLPVKKYCCCLSKRNVQSACWHTRVCALHYSLEIVDEVYSGFFTFTNFIRIIYHFTKSYMEQTLKTVFDFASGSCIKCKIMIVFYNVFYLRKKLRLPITDKLI